MMEHDMKNIRRYQFERLDTAARRSLKTVQQCHGGFDIAHFGKGRGARDRLREQFHRRGGDHTKRALDPTKRWRRS